MPKVPATRRGPSSCNWPTHAITMRFGNSSSTLVMTSRLTASSSTICNFNAIFFTEMKVGDSVYLVTDQLKTGAGIPAMVCGMQDSTVELAIEEAKGTKVLRVKTWEVLPSNLFTHSVLNVVYQAYQEIERDCGSILNLKPEKDPKLLIWHAVKTGFASKLALGDAICEDSARDAQRVSPCD